MREPLAREVGARLHPDLRVEGRTLTSAEYVRAIWATDVNLGFLRRQNRDLHTDRSVEIPACGGFLLAERSSEHEELFRGGEEADWFTGEDELVRKVRHWLDRPDERAQVARAGRARCVAGGYAWRDRLGEMLRIAHEECS